MSQSCRHHLPCNCNRIDSETIARIKDYIKRCIQQYMSLAETVTYLQFSQQIHAQTTKTVWENLERANPDCFKAYYLRRAILSQIMSFNSLVEQVALMFENGQFDLNNLPPIMVNFISQHPELQTRILQIQANSTSHRSDVRPQSLSLPDLNYPLELLQFPDDQQPEEHHDQPQQHHRSDVSPQSFPLPDPIGIGVPTISKASTVAQDPSTSQITEEASMGNITEETPTESTTEQASMDCNMEEKTMGNITEVASMDCNMEEAQTRSIKGSSFVTQKQLDLLRQEQ